MVDDRAQCRSLLGPKTLIDEPLGQKTTYRVGGRASLFFEVQSEEDLARVREAIGQCSIEILVVGNGSNLLVADHGFSGLAIRLGGAFAELAVDPDAAEVVAGGAVAYPLLARRSAAVGLTGLEWAVGIPGSVGGAVAMNAGGHGSETCANLVSCRVVSLSTDVDEQRPVRALECSYRHCALRADELVLDAAFSVNRAEDPKSPLVVIDEIVSWRREHQPGGRNCGSVFTNPPGDSAGRLIEACGLKGLRVKTAVVSTKHANFIQADQGGSADDVRELIDLVRDLVFERCGIELRPELRMVGFSS